MILSVAPHRARLYRARCGACSLSNQEVGTPMNYINGGARAMYRGPILTKAALKAAVKAYPEDVEFFSTSELGATFNGPVSQMPADAVLQVCGPDPYRNRRWYASVKRTAKGVTVS